MKKIFILVPFIFLVFILINFYQIINIADIEQININDHIINYSIDKTKYQPLEKIIIKIETDKKILPIILKIIKEESIAKDFISKQIDGDVSEISIIEGGELGTYKIYFEKNGKIISSELQYQLDAENFINTGDLQFDGFPPSG